MADSLDAGSFSLESYHYELPASLIAQHPSPDRPSSRLLVLDHRRGTLLHRRFFDLPELLVPGDLLVLNDTRVVPARVHGRKQTGGRVELLVLNPWRGQENGAAEGTECLIRSSKPTRSGSTLLLDGGLKASVLSTPCDGVVRVRFRTSEPLLELLDRIGRIPLPPYIERDPDASGATEDARSYQTVYATRAGAVAAPTAGLHFTDDLLACLQARGVERATVTLHVGYGTFAPMRVSDVREHVLHSEYAAIDAATVNRIRSAKAEGRRVLAVGTTVVRALEWAASGPDGLAPRSGSCSHYIYPGYPFRVVDAMITNFHLPKSSLLLLVSAFAGREAIMDAYRTAIREKYRFFSYGDAMLLL